MCVKKRECVGNYHLSVCVSKNRKSFVGRDDLEICVCVTSSEDEAAVVMMIRKRKGKAVNEG